MKTDIIYCESNENTLADKIDTNSIDLILTSPFYNSTTVSGTLDTATNGKSYPKCRYDVFSDSMPFDEYIKYNIRLFEAFDRVLKVNGVILWNLSYGTMNPDGMFETVCELVRNTNFSIADCIIWKKKSAQPNNVSANRLTRITEFVFVFVRKNELTTFYTNKKSTGTSKTGQLIYENVFNFVEAKNNDGDCPYNKATYSTELCGKLLHMYCPKKEDCVVYDPFMGTGTTAVACKQYGVHYIGSEISENQCDYAEERLKYGDNREMYISSEDSLI